MITLITYFSLCFLFICISLFFVKFRASREHESIWVYGLKIVPISFGCAGLLFPFFVFLGYVILMSIRGRDLGYYPEVVFILAAAISLFLLSASLYAYAKRNLVKNIYKIFASYAFLCASILGFATFVAIKIDLIMIFDIETPSSDEAINPYKRLNIEGLFFYEIQDMSAFTSESNLRIAFNSGKKIAILPRACSFGVYKIKGTKCIYFKCLKRNEANPPSILHNYIIDLVEEKIYLLARDNMAMLEIKAGDIAEKSIFALSDDSYNIGIDPCKLIDDNLEFLGIVDSTYKTNFDLLKQN